MSFVPHVNMQLCLWLVLFTASPMGHSAENRLLVLGDSISAGYGIELSQGWVTLLENELSGKFENIEVINASISGETSDGVVRRLPTLVSRYQPRWAIVEIGGNDGLRGYPLQGLSANLNSIILTLKNAGADVLLLGMQIPPNYGTRYTSAFMQMYATAATEHDIPLVPFFLERVAGDPSLMQEDGIHPTAEAQPTLMNAVLPALLEILSSSPSDQAQNID